MANKILKHQDLMVYRKAFEASMRIFEVTKSFPKEETYSLTDQIRRASRSVAANIAEAWRKRRYAAAKELFLEYEEIIAILVSMRNKPESWTVGPKK